MIATVTPAGSVIAVQSRVQVQGRIVSGVLVATSVQVDASNDGQQDHGGNTGNGGRFQIAGAILGLDTAHQTHTMRGPTTVSYATATFSSGTSADLAVGKAIEVKGNLSMDGGQVIATEIKFGH